MRKAVLNKGSKKLINRSYNYKNGFTNLKMMLQNFGTALSREQMKNVKGGVGGGTVCGCDSHYNCICGSTTSCSADPNRTDCIVCNGTQSCATPIK